jgi:hypothetical protein
VIRRCSAPLSVLVAALSFGSALQPMSAQADGITSGMADYTLTTTTALAAPTGPVPGTPSVTLNGTLASGSSTVSVPSTKGLAVGYEVTGTGITGGTTISQINTSLSQVSLSQNATATGSQSLVFTPVIAPPQVLALVQPAGGVVTPPSTSTLGPLTILANSSGFNASGVYDFLASTKDANGQPLQALGLSFFGQGLAAGGMLNFSLNVANASAPPQLQSQPPASRSPSTRQTPSRLPRTPRPVATTPRRLNPCRFCSGRL